MKKEYLDIITEHLGVEPILINSALVSAQNRQRYYWTNIPEIAQPKDKGIVLKDILETNTDSKYSLSEEKKDRVLNAKRGKGYFYNRDSKKIGTIISGYHKEPTDGSYLEIQNKPKQVGIATDINGHDILKRVYSQKGKSPTINSMNGGNREPKVMIDKTKPNQINPSKKASGKQPYMQDRVFAGQGKAHALTATFANRTNVGLTRDTTQDIYWRKLTPLECERLQTVTDNYTQGVSNTQRYKMLGNGWTVDVICHILSHLYFFKGDQNE